jgi:DNA polymerase III subunit epsilon
VEQQYWIQNLDGSTAIIGNFILGEAVSRVRSTVALTGALLVPQAGTKPQYLITGGALYELQAISSPVPNIAESSQDAISKPSPKPELELSDHERAKREAAQWARDLLASGPFVVFDTETTGLTKGHDEIVQICIVSSDGNVQMDQLIKPTTPIGAKAAAVHGITDAKVANASTFDQFYTAICDLLHGKTVIAYNLDFDLPMLAGVVAKHKLDPIEPATTGCAMLEFAKFYGEWNDWHGSYKWQKLATAASHFGLKWDGSAHDAAADVKMTIEVIKKMAEYNPA